MNSTLTARQYAEKHGVAPSTVRLWFRTGLVPEAEQLGGNGLWLVPADAARPVDAPGTGKVGRPRKVVAAPGETGNVIYHVRDGDQVRAVSADDLPEM